MSREHLSPAWRITAVLFAAQSLASAAFIATSTVAAIVGAELSGHRSWAGVPSAASTLAGSGAAFLWGILMDRIGRRASLALGLLVGACGADQRRSFRAIFRVPAARAALAAMGFSQVVMVAVTVITSLYMEDMHHGLGDISMVFSAHTIGMYAFSLFLLGLGWNFCFVGGSTLLADQLSPAERGRTQSFNDFLVGLAAAAGSLVSGLISARFGYAGVGAAGAALALLPCLFVARWARAERRLAR
jgi:MFS family permease